MKIFFKTYLTIVYIFIFDKINKKSIVKNNLRKKRTIEKFFQKKNALSHI